MAGARGNLEEEGGEGEGDHQEGGMAGEMQQGDEGARDPQH